MQAGGRWWGPVEGTLLRASSRGGAGPHLQHGHLPPAAEQGHSHTQLVGTEAITLAGRREVEPLEVGDVVVSVQDGALSMPELGTGAWVQGAAGTRSHVR